MKRPLVVLFDIDGTLIRSGGAGGRSMRAAFGEEHGASDALDGMDFRGMTDPLIVSEGLRRVGVEVTDASINSLINAYLAHLEREIPASERYEIMPGLDALLGALEADAGVALGLGTGNVERGARIKLARAGLPVDFAFGGFGCDASARHDLLAAGFERGAKLLGVDAKECARLAIGDTPLDVAGAQGCGAECIGVATGGYTVGALLESGAVAAFEDLRDPAVFEALGLAAP